jgi:hypothetical protein
MRVLFHREAVSLRYLFAAFTFVPDSSLYSSAPKYKQGSFSFVFMSKSIAKLTALMFTAQN